MPYLTEFIEWLQHGRGDVHIDANDLLSFSNEMHEALKNQYTTHREFSPLRVSSLGKPAVLQGLGMLGYHDNDIERRLNFIFLTGHYFEAWLVTMMKAYGMKVVSQQSEVNYLGVLGHTDVIVELNGAPLLVEVKTMSDSYFNQFTKKPNDERGYITQLAIYKHCLGIPAVWLCYNKGTGDIREVEMSDTTWALERANDIIPLLRDTRFVSDVFKHFDAPEPVPEVFKRKETGMYLIPPSMRWSKYADVFYHITTDKNGYNKDTRYVTGYTTPEEGELTLQQMEDKLSDM